MFKNTESLNNVYKDFVRHGMLVFDSPDVIRFLQQKLTKAGAINGNFKCEVISDFKNRQESIRIKHWLESNSVKFYNKAGSVLRIESTINDPSDFKVFRPNINTGELQWQPMRKSVEDIQRRAEVSNRIVAHYAEALALANVDENLIKLIQPTLVRKEVGPQKIRALDPLGKDSEMLKAIINGKFHINGFRNKDIRSILFKETNLDQNKKNTAKVSRLLKIHGIIKKVYKTHRYEVTKKGVQVISALNVFETARVKLLCKWPPKIL